MKFKNKKQNFSTKRNKKIKWQPGKIGEKICKESKQISSFMSSANRCGYTEKRKSCLIVDKHLQQTKLWDTC